MANFIESSEESAVELCILTIKECFVYKVPPLRTASGHRAEDWNLANPLLTGCVKLFQRGETLRLVIYSFKDPKNTNVTDENIQVFGECPIGKNVAVQVFWARSYPLEGVDNFSSSPFYSGETWREHIELR
jgi:hypothetical protein